MRLVARLTKLLTETVVRFIPSGLPKDAEQIVVTCLPAEPAESLSGRAGQSVPERRRSLLSGTFWLYRFLPFSFEPVQPLTCKMVGVHKISHPIVNAELSKLRLSSTTSKEFREVSSYVIQEDYERFQRTFCRASTTLL